MRFFFFWVLGLFGETMVGNSRMKERCSKRKEKDAGLENFGTIAENACTSHALSFKKKLKLICKAAAVAHNWC